MLTQEAVQKLEQEAKAREMSDLRVFVVGGGFQYAKMFFDAGFRGARSVTDANVVCFTGGADVNPSLYGERALSETSFDARRDAVETAIFADAAALSKPMIGICRGAQFLNVMAGGKLWQDVNNHAVYGGHDVVDMRDGSIRKSMTSTHHQQMIAPDGAEVIATACRSTKKKSEGQHLLRTDPENDDLEVLWIPKTLSLCFQPHPEFSYGSCRDFFLDLVDEYVLPAC